MWKLINKHIIKFRNSVNWQWIVLMRQFAEGQSFNIDEEREEFFFKYRKRHFFVLLIFDVIVYHLQYFILSNIVFYFQWLQYIDKVILWNNEFAIITATFWVYLIKDLVVLQSLVPNLKNMHSHSFITCATFLHVIRFFVDNVWIHFL